MPLWLLSIRSSAHAVPSQPKQVIGQMSATAPIVSTDPQELPRKETPYRVVTSVHTSRPAGLDALYRRSYENALRMMAAPRETQASRRKSPAA